MAWGETMRIGLMMMAAAAALGAGVAFSGGAKAATPRDTLVIALSMSNMLSLDPALSGELEASETMSNLYDRLVMFDAADDDKLKPQLAQSWDMAPDGTVTFHLRPGIKFQSGDPVTADDVVWSLKRLVALNLEQAQRLTEWGYTAQNFDQYFKTIDPLTVTVKPVGPPNPNLAAVFGQPVMDVLDRKVVDAHAVNDDWGHTWLNTHSAGSGPFSVVTWQPNDILVMRRNPQYWRDTPKLARIILRNVPESQVQRLQIEHGDIDVAYRLTAGDLDAADKAGAIDIMPGITRGFYYVGVNTLDPIFANQNVREALHWLVDPPTLSRDVAGHFGPEWHTLPIFKDQPGGLPDEPWHFDPEKAKALLAKTPYPNGFSADLLVLPDSPFIELATAVQASLAKGGIKVNIKTGSGNIVYGAARKRTYQMILGRASITLPMLSQSIAQEFMYNPDNTPNSTVRHLAYRSGFQNADANKLLDELRYTADPAKEAAIDQQLQQIFINNAWPYILLVRRADPIAVRKDVHGYYPSQFWTTRWDIVSKD
jgi:peptide/nickel transport system substrate-binding protein